jgi:hypothetical protein
LAARFGAVAAVALVGGSGPPVTSLAGAGKPAPPFGVEATGAAPQGSVEARRIAGQLTLKDAGLDASFDASGARLDARAGGEVTIRLLAFGIRGRLNAIAPVAPTARANTVSYRWPRLQSWYRNGPLGLEQGFRVSSPPAAGHGALTLEFGLGGSLAARRSGSGLRFATAAGVTRLSYGAVSVLAANGRALPATLQLDGKHLFLRVFARGARYPLEIDPLIEAGGKLTGGGEVGDGGFGGSVAVSADGTTALVGGDSDDEGQGAAWVYTRSGDSWKQQGPKLAVPEGELFGASVALSGDGNTALVGAPDLNDVAGAAFVFTRSGGRWRLQQRLHAEDEGGGGWFGSSVALSGNGTTALVGGSLDDGGQGSAWVFTRSGNRWSEQGAKLVPGSASTAGFGSSVALSSNGEIALVGATGSAWLFTRTGAAWRSATSALRHGGGNFGSSVALSGSGKVALIGDYAVTGDSTAWIFTPTGSGWRAKAALSAGAAATGTQFGYSVSLSASGDLALVGAPLGDGGVGAAWLFSADKGSWEAAPTKLSGSGESGEADFGSSVALASEGTQALAGGPLDDGTLGAAWIFSRGS